MPGTGQGKRYGGRHTLLHAEYARRDELPKAYRIGRYRIEGIVADLLEAGFIIQGVGGALTVPKMGPGN